MGRIRPAVGIIPAETQYRKAHGTWISSAGFRCHFFDGKVRRVYDWAILIALGLPDDPFNRILIDKMAERGLIFAKTDWRAARRAADRAYRAARIPSERELNR